MPFQGIRHVQSAKPHIKAPFVVEHESITWRNWTSKEFLSQKFPFRDHFGLHFGIMKFQQALRKSGGFWLCMLIFCRWAKLQHKGCCVSHCRDFEKYRPISSYYIYAFCSLGVTHGCLPPPLWGRIFCYCRIIAVCSYELKLCSFLLQS